MALKEFLDYLEEQYRNHSIYVFGAQGEDHTIISVSWIEKMETTPNNAQRAIKHWKKECDLGYGMVLRAFDCSGLGLYKLHQMFGTPDMTASNMYKNLCEPISRDEAKKGDWVFHDNGNGIHHVGYIVDDDRNVIECKGRDYGVVKQGFNVSSWNKYGRPKVFKDEIEGKTICKAECVVLKKGSHGYEVKVLQSILNLLGYDLKVDGSFGNKTSEAVKDFKKKWKLGSTDEVNTYTWTYLLMKGAIK